MKNYTEITRLDTTGSPIDYPNGQLKQATDKYIEDGTVVNKIFLQDWWNMIWKCVRLSGITPNNNFDTDGNSQMFDAVKIAMSFPGEKMVVTTASGSPFTIPDNVSIVEVALTDEDTPIFYAPNPIKGRKLSIYTTPYNFSERDFWLLYDGTNDKYYTKPLPWLISILLEADGNRWHIVSQQQYYGPV